MSLNSFLFCCVVFISLVGCKASKNIASKADKSSISTVSEVVSLIETNDFDFQTFEAKVKVAYSGDDKNLSFKTKLRIQKDEKVWLSATLFGFEAVRALITPDSVQVINRFNKEYYIEPIDKLEQISGLPVNFNSFQNLLLGRPLIIDKQDIDFRQEEDHIIVESKPSNLSTKLTYDLALINLLEQFLQQTNADRMMKVLHSDFSSKDDGQSTIPLTTEVSVEGEKELMLELNFSDIEWNNNPNFNFNINDQYDRKRL